MSGRAACAVEHPIHIKESLGMIRGKNDKVDAQRIALYAYKNREEVHLWTPKREVIQKLDRLTATRSRLVKVRKIRTADAAPVSVDRFGWLYRQERPYCREEILPENIGCPY